MSTYSKIPITSIFYQLSMYLPEEEFDEDKITELAISCYRQIGHEVSHESNVTKVEIKDHMAILPVNNFYKIKQAFIRPLKDGILVQDIPKTSNNDDTPEFLTPPVSLWENFGPSVNTLTYPDSTFKYSVMYHDKNLTLETDICDDISVCIPSFKIKNIEVNGVDKKVIYTNAKSGIVLLHYEALSMDIEDDEELKQAIIKYVVSNILLTKGYSSMDARLISLGTEKEREAKTFMGKVKGKLNSPDELTLEKIRVKNNGMIPYDEYATGFRFNPHKLRTML